MKRLAVLAALLFSAAASTASPLVDVSVTDLDANQLLTTYPDRGRTYVAGAPGHRYSLTLRNNTSQRVLAVVSVDGVNAVTGESAAAKQSGYVLGPWETTEVRGWRKSLSDVAEFYFTELPDSYAARTGRPDNVGVIGVAVYREKVQPIAQQPSISDEERKARAYGESGGSDTFGTESRAREPAAAGNGAYADRQGAARSAADAASAPAPASPMARAPEIAKAEPRQELGTGHGNRRYDPVNTTAFVRATNRPEQVVSLFYDSYAVLVDRGIIPQPYRPSRREPDPFPIGFVPDPN